MNNWLSQLLEGTSDRGRNAARLAIIFIAAAFLAVLIFTYVAIQTGAWQVYTVVAGFMGFFALEFLVINLARRNRTDAAGFLLVAAVCYIVLVMTAFINGIGLGLSIALALVIVEIVFETLSRPQNSRAQISGFAFAVSMLILDQFAWWDRPSFSIVRFAIPLIAAGTVISISLLMLGRFNFWNNLNLTRKLLVAFGALFLFGLVIAGLSLFGLSRVQDSYEKTLAGGIEIRFRSDQLNTSLLEARRREKDFLLRWRDEGFDVAYDNYVKVNRGHTAEMKETLKQLEALAPAVEQASLTDYSQEQYEADLIEINQDLLIYEQSFSNVVDLLEQRGFIDTGLEGQFHVSVQAMESKIYEREGLDSIVITMLQIRRSEKDYLLRGDQQYVDNVHDLVAQLKDQVGATEQLNPSEKTEIIALADDYLAGFDGLVEKDQQVAEATEVFRATAQEIQVHTDELATIGVQLAEQDIQTAETNSLQTFTITSVTVFLVLVLSIVLAFTLSRQITNPVLVLTDVAHQLESGNYDVQAEISTGDEIGTLAKTFNGMARQIKQTLATIAQRATELQTVAEVSASTSTVLETEKLLWNVSNLTKERFRLYHAHIYLMNDARDTLVLAAGAGEAGQQMVAEGRSIPLDREQSLVARSARERRGVIVNDVRSAPDFLPNPLLPETRSELAVPMLIGDDVIGVFDIQSDKVDNFTQENADIQTTLASQIAIAVQNARSYTQVQARADREALIASIGQKIQGTSTVESALQIAVRELGHALSQKTRVVLNASQASAQPVAQSPGSNGDNGSNHS